MEDVQDLCVKSLTRHFVMFNDLYSNKRQVQVSNFCVPHHIVSVHAL